MGQFVKPREERPDDLGLVRVDFDSAFVDDYPALAEYMTLNHWDNGDARETATLLIFVEDGRFKACVNDREESRSGWVSADGFRSLLEAVEKGLREGTIDWRRRGGVGRGKK